MHPFIESGNRRHKIDVLVEEFVILLHTILSSTKDWKELYDRIVGMLELGDLKVLIDLIGSRISEDRQLRYLLDEFSAGIYDVRLTSEEKAIVISKVAEIVVDRPSIFGHSIDKLQRYKHLLSEEKDVIEKDEKKNIDSILRIAIHGDWYFDDLDGFMMSIRTAYRRLFNVYFADKYLVSGEISDFYTRFNFDNVRIIQIKYASPGHFDLLGIGKVFEQICHLINRVVHWHLTNEVEKAKLINELLDELKKMNTNINGLKLDEDTQEDLRKDLNAAIFETISLVTKNKISGASMNPLREVNQ